MSSLFTRFLFIALLLAVPVLAKAQTTLTGTALESDGTTPVSFATAIAYGLPDSNMVANATTDLDGGFSLSLKPGRYYLELQFLGYADKVISGVEVAPSGKTIDLGPVTMLSSDVALDLVEVTAERSTVALKLDKRVFTVGKDLTSVGSTAADILNSVPSVTVDTEGAVKLRGGGGVRILVDGKPSAMLSSGDLNALQRMQGDIIESIEVITNPSAKYEAEGEAGIINIVLKKDKKKGFNGSFGGNVGAPHNHAASYNLNYRQGDLNFFSNFGIGYRRAPGGGSSTQRFFDEAGKLTSAYDQTTDQDRGGLGGNIQLGLDWYITPRDVLTGALLYRKSVDVNNADVVYRDLDAELDPTATTLRRGVEDSNNDQFESSLTYKRTFDREDQEWTVDFKYILDDDLELTDFRQVTRPLLVDPILDPIFPITRQNASNTEYETNLLLQTDYVHPFNDSLKLEGGMRTALRTIRNAYFVEEATQGGEFTTLEGFDDELEYTENIYAAYLIGSAEFGKVGLQAGLRGELSDINAVLAKAGTESPQNYFNLFPSASVSYQFTELTQLQASYSRRLSRPYFRLLLPFSNFNDPRGIPVGNPSLAPEYSDSYELSALRYLPKGSVLASVYYRRTTGVIERLVLPQGDGTSVRFPVNLATRDAYGVEVTASYDLAAWWKFNADFNLYTADLVGTYEGQFFSADIASWSGRVGSKFDVTERLQVQGTFDYRAPENTAQGRNLELYSFDVGASLDVLAGRGTLTLSGRDIFNTRIERTIIDRADFASVSDFQWRRAQSVVVGFVYRLGQERREG